MMIVGLVVALVAAVVLGQLQIATEVPRDLEFVSVVSSDTYAIGASVLACSLQRVHNAGLTVIVGAGVSNNAIDLLKRYTFIRFVPCHRNDLVTIHVARNNTLDKLCLWRVQAKKVVYLDADTVVVGDLTPLVDSLDSDHDFAVVGSTKYMNTGIMVLRPSNATFGALLSVARSMTSAAESGALGEFTEQDILLQYFATSSKTRFVDNQFNFRPLHQKIGLRADTRVVHFIGNPKPWDFILDRHTSNDNSTASVQKDHLPQWSIALFKRQWRRAMLCDCQPRSTASGSQ